MNDALAAQRAGLDPLAFDAVGRIGIEIDGADPVPALPGDHPAWQRDVVSISSRARALIAALQPIVLKVLNFWDHRIGTLVLGGRTLSVDPSGSYRLR